MTANLIATNYSGTSLRVYDVPANTAAAIDPLTLTGDACGIAFSPDFTKFAYYDRTNNQVTIASYPANATLATCPSIGYDISQDNPVAWTPDGSTVVALGSSTWAINASTGAVISSCSPAGYDLCIDPAGVYCYYTDGIGGNVHKMTIATGAVTAWQNITPQTTYGIAISPDGLYVVVGTGTTHALVYNTSDGSLNTTIAPLSPSICQQITFLPNQSALYITCQDSPSTVYPVAFPSWTAGPGITLSGQTANPAIAAASNSAFVYPAVYHNNSIDVIEVATNTNIASLAATGAEGVSVSLFPIPPSPPSNFPSSRGIFNTRVPLNTPYRRPKTEDQHQANWRNLEFWAQILGRNIVALFSYAPIKNGDFAVDAIIKSNLLAQPAIPLTGISTTTDTPIAGPINTGTYIAFYYNLNGTVWKLSIPTDGSSTTWSIGSI